MSNAENGAGVITEFSAAELVPWPGLNPRRSIDPEKLAELTASVREDGVLQPILVHDTGESVKWIVAGQTRWAAARAAGRPIPAIVKQLTEAKALRVALLENMHRNDLTPIEEARGFARMLQLEPDLTEEQLGRQMGGKSQEFVANRIRLLKLPADILGLIEDGTIGASIARDHLLPFANIPEKKRKDLFARVMKEIRATPPVADGKIAVRGEELQAYVSRNARELSKPVSTKDGVTPVFDPKLHAKECTCQAPRFRYTNYGQATQRCFDEKWWEAAQAAARRRRKKERDAQAATAKKTVKGAKAGAAMDSNAFVRKHGYNLKSLDQQLVDVSKLEGAEFVTVKPSWGEKKVQVYCTDVKKLAAALKVVEDERDLLTDQIAAEVKQKDADEAGKLKVEPWMFREVFLVEVRLGELLAEFGIKCNWQNQDKAVRALSDDQATLLFKVMALRGKRGDYAARHYGRDNPVGRRVEEILTKKYGPARDALRDRIVRGKKEEKPAAKPVKAKKRELAGAAEA